MSTENLPYGPGNDGYRQLTLFLAISLAIHACLALVAFTSETTLRLLADRARDREPIYVDVIDLPPDHPAQKGPQKGIMRYADRTNVVEKETFPEATGAIAIPGTPGTAQAPRTAPVKDTAPKAAEKAPPAGAVEPADTPALKAVETMEDEAGAGVAEEKGAQDLAPAVEGERLKGALPRTASPARPNLLLTEEKLAELAKKYEQESPAGEKGKTLQLNTTELKYQKYLINMKHRIEFYWEYPVLAVQNGWQGKLNIDFTIKKDGTIGEIFLRKSSGYPALDDAARTALKLAAPFPPFPEDFSIEQISIKGQFEYNLRYAPPPPLR